MKHHYFSKQTDIDMTNPSKISELERLKKLKDEGVLSDEEYNKLKQDILYDSEPLNPASKADAPILDKEPQNTQTPSVSQDDTKHTSIAQPKAEDTTSPSQEKQNIPKKLSKKLNSTFIGFAIAVAVVTIGFIVALSLSNKDSKTTTTTTEASAPDTLPEEAVTNETLLKGISGVWSTQNNQISIVYENSNFQFWTWDTQALARLGDIDLKNESVNIIFTSKADNYESIVTVKRKWNNDKTNFILDVTGEIADEYDNIVLDGDYKLVRKISNDDLNRLAKLAAQQQKQIAFENQNIARSVAENYAADEINATNGNDLAGYYANEVKYFGKVLSSANVIKDKNKFYKKWTSLEKDIVGNVQIKDGANGQKIVSYTYNYVVSNDKEEIRGTAIQTVVLAKISDSFYIIEESNKNTKSEKKDLTQNPEGLEFTPDGQSTKSNEWGSVNSIKQK